jgi:sec-independent protein translocase protein TatC
MCMLAFPMLVLFLVAEAIARGVDRTRGRRRRAAAGQWADDEASPL